MESKLNVSVLLCEKSSTDETDNVRDLNNIFNSAVLDENNEIDVAIITIVNGINYQATKTALYYVIQLLTEDENETISMFLGSLEFSSTEEVAKTESGQIKKASMPNSFQNTIKTYEGKLDFPQEGQYELMVFCVEEADIKDVDNMDSSERRKYLNADRLISSYSFEVRNS